MRISVEQLNGQTLSLKVSPHNRMQQVKKQIRRMYTWEDELSPTTLVELIVGDKKVMDEETVEELGLGEDSQLTVMFKKNVIKCCNKSGVGPDLDPEALVIVEVPDSETTIETQAFRACSRLGEVIIPSSVTSIGPGAFFDCSSLVSVGIPNSVRLIPDRAFCGCRALTEVTIPDSITHIGAHAFMHCYSLTEVTLPDSIIEIGDETFFDCSYLVSVNIPGSVRRIGETCLRRQLVEES